MYEKELEALRRAGRFRERVLYDERLIDCASNDYLGLSASEKSFKKACKTVQRYKTLSAKASMLVNGYHPIHRIFESEMAELNGFEEGLVVGSGFLANMALIEALVRKGDVLFIDEEYHASGVMAARLLGNRAVYFRHNDADDLAQKLASVSAKRRIVAIEGIYSMSGDICNRAIFDVADRYDALLIVDEAHSSGVLGENLTGVFEHYGIVPHARHIKMGTLGKAYGSYGAYILASKTIVRFLENRAKPIIYSTAPSVFDIALAYVNMRSIRKKAEKYRRKIARRQALAEEILGIKPDGLILPVPMPDNEFALFMRDGLLKEGYLVGAIRPPTVEKPILRVILNTSVSLEKLKHLLALIRLNLVE